MKKKVGTDLIQIRSVLNIAYTDTHTNTDHCL